MALLSRGFGPGTGTADVAFRLLCGLRQAGADVVLHTDDPRGAEVDARPLGDPWTAAARVEPGRVRIALDRVPGCEIVRASGGVHEAYLEAVGTSRWRRWRGAVPSEQARLERAACREARMVVVNAARVAGEIVARHGLPPSRVRLVRTGVDLERHRPDRDRRQRVRAELGSPARVAVFVGHGFHRKNLRCAVAAFQVVARPEDRLVVVGRDVRPARYLPDDPRVLAVGASDPGPWLDAADAMLLPTRYDPAANATLEALAHGVPPCVSGADGMAEIVPDRRLVVRDPDDVRGFARALSYAWLDADLPARCRHVAERWPALRMVDELVGLAAEIVDG
ncbi:MAG: glycosyltransferase family 4 protein [Alphaproteobacteria bacterium]|nr:glycosyltransferase family 4 protein [Alphaproteobacteria bacterium]MCB9696825.1 glycosyltransferase family 4 protein [Alphaproteobacteria bacterium]